MKLEIGPGIEGRFRSALKSARRREIGGMLFAEQLAPGHFRIIDFSLDSFSGSHTNFRRDPITHRTTLDAFFDKTGRDYARFNYLGEWHSHPSFSVRPSSEDISTMTEIVSDADNTITFALLLIVRLRMRFILESSWTLFSDQQAPQRLRLASRLI